MQGGRALNEKFLVPMSDQKFSGKGNGAREKGVPPLAESD